MDIIFENRNKDYGAYVLRKDYNKRLFKSLVMALALAIMLILWLMVAGKNATSNLTIVPFIPNPSISPIRPIEKIVVPEKYICSKAKVGKSLGEIPVIVKNEVEKPVPANVQILDSDVGNIEAFSEAPDAGGNNTAGVEINESAKPPVLVDKNVPVTFS